MMYDFSIETKSGNKLDFSNSSRYGLYQIDELCPVAASLNFTEIAGYDGAMYNSSRLSKRNLVLYIKLYPDVEENRNYLYQYLAPKSKVRCYYKNGLRDVYIDGYVETCDVTPFTNNEVVQASIICPDPYWKDLSETEISFSSIEDGFEFPFSAPEEGLSLGGIKTETTAIIDSGGGGGFEFEFHIASDSVQRPMLYNLANGQYFGLDETKTELKAGDVIQVSTLSGDKHVYLIRDGVTTNILGSMYENSAFIQLESGENELELQAMQGLDYITVIARIRRKYQGV